MIGPPEVLKFQSPTGSKALPDRKERIMIQEQKRDFNPKREARPSQTKTTPTAWCSFAPFQSQTGSQALSDSRTADGKPEANAVSIPNGKPGPLRLRRLVAPCP